MAKSDEARGAVALWLRRERLARQWSTEEAVKKLRAHGLHITEASYRGYEAGPRVSRSVREAAEALYGTTAPLPRTDKERAGDLPALVEAIRDQTAAISELVEVVRDLALTRPASLDDASVQAVVAALVRGDRLGDEPEPPQPGMQP